MSKVVTSLLLKTTVTTTNYLGGYQYQGVGAATPTLQFFPTAEGYFKQKTGNAIGVGNYVFNYTDHLGNVRLSYEKDATTGSLKILEESNYYPFGMKHSGYNSVVTSTSASYKYKYNGKELQDELGLNVYDYGWRNYMPDIGRWTQSDPLLNDLKFTFDDSKVDEDDDDEVYEALITKLETADGIFNTNNLNPYGYGYNNPVSFDDPDGRCPWCLYAVAAFLYSEFANAPTGDAQTDSRNYEASKGNRTIVSETVLKRGGNILSGTPGRPGSSSAISPNKSKKAETLAKNQEKGKKFEDKVGKDLEKGGHKNIQDQVTIKPNGAKGNVKMDKVSTKDGKTVLTEAKSSKTAPLTKNQKSGFPAIEKNGGTVVGKGKPGYPGGTTIPPTKVNVVRPGE